MRRETSSRLFFLFPQLEEEESPCLEQFNIVISDHGHTQKCDFCVSVCKANFTDHHTPDTRHGFSIVLTMVLEIRFWSVKCTPVTVRYAKNEHPIPSQQRCKRLQRLDYMKTNHFKMLLNLFSTTYLFKLYSVCIILLLKNNLTNICSKIIKPEMNGLYLQHEKLWKDERWLEGECTLYR